MNLCLILLILLTVASGCFAKRHPRKRSVSSVKVLDSTKSPDGVISTIKERPENFSFSDFINQSFSTQKFELKQTVTSKNDAGDIQSTFMPISSEKQLGTLILDSPKARHTENLTSFANKSCRIQEPETNQPRSSKGVIYSKIIVISSKKKLNTSNLIKHIQEELEYFFNMYENQSPIVKQEDFLVSDFDDHKIKRRDSVTDFFEQAKNTVIETSKSAVKTTEDVVKIAGDHFKKIFSRNASYFNTDCVNGLDGSNSTTTDTELHTCSQNCENTMHIFLNDTVVTKTLDDKEKILEQNTTEIANSQSNIGLLKILNDENVLDKNKQTTVKQFDFNTHVTQKDLKLAEETKINHLEEFSTNTEINSKSIDKSTKYFFGEGNTDENFITTRYQIKDESIETEGVKIETTKIPLQENYTTGYQKQHFKDTIEKCQGNGNQCIHNKAFNKRSIEQHNTAPKSIHDKINVVSQNPFKTDFVTEPNELNNTANVPTSSEMSTQTINKSTLKIDWGAAFFRYKDWLWQHLEATKNESKLNSTKDFFKVHHFLFNSGGTEQSATANFFAIALKNKIDNANQTVDLNNMLLDQENLKLNLNSSQNLLLKRYRRIRRNVPKKRRYKPVYVDNEMDSNTDDKEVSIERLVTPFDEELEKYKSDYDTMDDREVSLGGNDFSKSSTVSTSPIMKLTTTIKNRKQLGSEIIPTARLTRSPKTTPETDEFQRVTEIMISLLQKKQFKIDHQYETSTEQSDFDKEEQQAKATTKVNNAKQIKYLRRGNFEQEWNDGGGLSTRPLLLIVTVPSFIGIGLFIIVLCFLTRTTGWCCRLFATKRSSHVSKDV